MSNKGLLEMEQVKPLVLNAITDQWLSESKIVSLVRDSTHRITRNQVYACLYYWDRVGKIQEYFNIVEQQSYYRRIK